MLPEVSTRKANETGALESRSKVSKATAESPTRMTKSSFAEVVHELPVLVGHQDGQHHVLGPRALGKGGRVGNGCRPRRLGRDLDRGRREQGRKKEAFHRLIIRPGWAGTFPAGLYRLSSLDDAAPVRGPGEAAQLLQPRLDCEGREELRVPEPVRRRARGPTRRGLRAAGGRRRRPSGVDRALRDPRGRGRPVSRRPDDLFAAGRGRDSDARSRRAARVSLRGGREPRRARLRARAQRADRGRARAFLGVPAPADRSGVSDDEPVPRRRGRPRRGDGLLSVRRRKGRRGRVLRPPPRSKARSATGTGRSKRSTSTTRATASGRCATGGAWSRRAR